MKKIDIKIINLLFFVAIFFSLTACTGKSLIQNLDEDESLTSFLANIQVVHHPTANGDGSFPNLDDPSGRLFENNLGFTITLTHATLSWQHLELISDGADPDCQPGNDQEIELNRTENLLGEDLVTSSLISHGIADVAYCQYHLSLGPSHADKHAIMLADHVEGEGTASTADNLTEDGEDLTIHLEGEWSLGADSGTFHIDSTEVVIVEGNFQALVDGRVEDHAVHFHSDESELTIVFGTSYDAIFEDVDFLTDSAEEVVAQVLLMLEQAVSQYLGEH